MKTLVIIRHAKSDWGTNAMDIDRQLTDLGERDAFLVAASAIEHLPEEYIIWSSVAKRTSRTALIFADGFSYPPGEILFKDALYTFDCNVLEKIIRTCPDRHEALIVFGHNEAVTDFVNKFGDIYIDNVPTAGFVKITFNVDSWREIRKGKTQKTIFPRDLRI